MCGEATDVMPTSGVVLAGGASRRMEGRDKRTVLVGGRPLLISAVEAVRAVCDEVMVATGAGSLPLALPGVRAVPDRRRDAGPLAGLEAGLAAAVHPVALVLAGDHPAAAPRVLAELRDRLTRDERLDAVVLGTSHGSQPLVGAYRCSCAPTVTRLLDGGERRARALLEVLDAEVVPIDDWHHLDPALLTGVDLDTPADLDSWRSRM